MAEGQARHQANAMSSLIATIVNSNPFRSGAPVKAETINPYADRTKQVVDMPKSEAWKAARSAFFGA